MSTKKESVSLLKTGYRVKASDMYIFPNKDGYTISYRQHHDIDNYKVISKDDGEKLILCYKYLAGMDVSEKRKVQMGGATLHIGGVERRVRMSTVGDFLNRETLVIRFLYKIGNESELKIMFPNQLEVLKHRVNKAGLYLFSGPTGAGKSTTMYVLAKHLLNKKPQQIITIEDPVEIEDEDFLQFQVNEKIHLTYESLIKVCLRHRPDILIVGEIRDVETAKIVVRAALTGHMVFSTIHATDKESVWIRLREFGIPDVEISQSLKGVIFQQLLPVNNQKGYSVLYDMWLNGEGTDWEKSLQEAVKRAIISEETYHAYKKENLY
ncbi:MAG: competence type IV pilus ATPase ComGA [Vagococcus sp.]